jgi:hypothetical protein
MAQIFNVTCPVCLGAFPCHPELWQAGYDLLCPFCGATFPQEESPLIVTGTGERRPGTAYRDGAPGSAQAPSRAGDAAESM